MVVSRVILTAIVPAAAGLLVVMLAGRARRRFVHARPRRPEVGAGPARRAILRNSRFARPARLSDDDVAAWCDDLARLVRSGASLAAALRSTSPAPALAPIVAPIGLALDRGDSVAGATRRVTTCDASVELALGVLHACAELGGPAAQPLDRAASTLRARAADLADRDVHSAQARLSAMVLTLMPVAALTLLLATSPASRAAVFGSAGLISLGAGAAINATGWWWMRRIIGGPA
jgi:Flp pilus assembly protein TadB